MLLSVDRTGGTELWAFDGTDDGTFSVFDSNATDPVVFNDHLYFVADSELGREVHITDGTQAGTQVFADLSPGPNDSDPGALVQYDEELWFIARTENEGFQHWVTDGNSPPAIRSSNPIEIPSNLMNEPTEVLLATDTWVLYSQLSYDTVALEGFGAPDGDWGSLIALDLWISKGSETDPELLARIEDVVEFAVPDSQAPTIIAQSFGDVLTNRMLTARELGEIMHYTSHVVDLPEEYAIMPESVAGGSDIARFISLSSALVTSPLQPGDATLDGRVLFEDFLVLSANFGKRDAVWQDGDFNADGTVDFADFLLLSANFDN